MANSFELQITGLDELEQALAQLSAEMPQILTAAMDETLAYLRQTLPPYPGGNAGELPKVYTRQPEKRGFKSAKQRRYFFWALRQGIIELHSGAYQSKFKSRKQQGYFFWAMASGKITIPYARTRKLGNSFHIESTVNGNEVIGSIGTAIQYGPYVIGDDTQQAPIHKDRWWQLADEVEQNLPGAAQAFEDAAVREIRKAIGST
jgi:hypothetical protein